MYLPGNRKQRARDSWPSGKLYSGSPRSAQNRNLFSSPELLLSWSSCCAVVPLDTGFSYASGLSLSKMNSFYCHRNDVTASFCSHDSRWTQPTTGFPPFFIGWDANYMYAFTTWFCFLYYNILLPASLLDYQPWGAVWVLPPHVFVLTLPIHTPACLLSMVENPRIVRIYTPEKRPA